MPAPYDGPTSAQFRPDLGTPQFSGESIPVATYGLVSTVPHVVYVVQDGDTLAQVARVLYGANNPQNRAKVRHVGFYPGAIHHVPASTFNIGD